MSSSLSSSLSSSSSSSSQQLVIVKAKAKSGHSLWMHFSSRKICSIKLSTVRHYRNPPYFYANPNLILLSIISHFIHSTPLESNPPLTILLIPNLPCPNLTYPALIYPNLTYPTSNRRNSCITCVTRHHQCHRSFLRLTDEFVEYAGTSHHVSRNIRNTMFLEIFGTPSFSEYSE